MSILNIVLVFLTASVKFLLAPTLALGLGFQPITAALITLVGGVTGILFFYLGADWLMDASAKRKLKKEELLRSQGKAVPEKKIFTKGRRRMIRVKNRFGIVGIAIVTPCIISIPIGCILAARFFKNRTKVLTAMFISATGWAFILTFLNKQVNDLINYLF
ncbi:MAG: hypothetical protein ACK40M_04735 [Flavobacteriales bacterium]